MIQKPIFCTFIILIFNSCIDNFNEFFEEIVGQWSFERAELNGKKIQIDSLEFYNYLNFKNCNKLLKKNIKIMQGNVSFFLKTTSLKALT